MFEILHCIITITFLTAGKKSDVKSEECMRMWARVWLDSASVTAAKQGLDTTNKHFRKHDRGPFVRSWDDQALIGNGEARAAHYFSPFYGMCSCIRLEDEHFASWTNILDIVKLRTRSISKESLKESPKNL